MKKQVTEPPTGCIDDQPVEDTTRVYLRPRSGDTLHLCPDLLYARFYPWASSDTNKILQLLEKYDLERVYNYFSYGFENHIGAKLKINKKRAEYYFTPYGKENFCNFGADSLVEYAFGIFDYGNLTTNGEIRFIFKENIAQTKIDSFFNAHRLRFLYTTPDYPSGGKQYYALITPYAKKNVLDLGYDFQSDSLLKICSVPLAGAYYPPNPKK